MKLYGRQFKTHVCQKPVACKKDRVITNRLLAVVAMETIMLDKDQMKKLWLSEAGHCLALEVCDRKLTLRVNGVHNVVLIDMVSLAKTERKCLPPADGSRQLSREKTRTPTTVRHSTARMTSSQANTQLVGWTMTVNKKWQNQTWCAGMGTHHLSTWKSLSSTSHITVTCDGNVEHTAHRISTVR